MTARDAIGAAVPALEAAGCDTPRLDAELLVAAALGVDRAALVTDPDSPVPPPAARLLSERIRRRIQREPVAYILGRKGFRHIDLAVDSRVLIPRPDTELLVEVALGLPEAARVHDVGTGSGAVALALLDERPDLRGERLGRLAAARGRGPRERRAPRRRARDRPLRGPPGRATTTSSWPTCRTCARTSGRASSPRSRATSRAGALVSGADGLDAIREPGRRRPGGHPAGAGARAGPGPRGA